jgi:uncharacterized damage-inducible protein DinB
MTGEHNVHELTVASALSGKLSHAESMSVLEGLDWKLAGARPEGASHSVFQLANHMAYWMEWAVKWLDGRRPRAPKHASGSWPGGESPATRKEWERTGKRFRETLEALERRSRDGNLLSRRGKMTRLEMLHIIAQHNSYHAGQVAFLRQMLGSWPPPSGGVTW